MKLSLNNVFQGNLSREADEVKKKNWLSTWDNIKVGNNWYPK